MVYINFIAMIKEGSQTEIPKHKTEVCFDSRHYYYDDMPDTIIQAWNEAGQYIFDLRDNQDGTYFIDVVSDY